MWEKGRRVGGALDGGGKGGVSLQARVLEQRGRKTFLQSTRKARWAWKARLDRSSPTSLDPSDRLRPRWPHLHQLSNLGLSLNAKATRQ